MNHKRRRHKAARAGCLLCKPHKRGAGMEHDLRVARIPCEWRDRAGVARERDELVTA